VQDCRVEANGRVRHLSISDGSEETEQLVAFDDRAHFYTYMNVTERGPSPIWDYESTIRVRDEGDSSVVEWVGSFETANERAERGAVAFIGGHYEAGLERLKAMLEG
jgi:hypothetical protein